MSEENVLCIPRDVLNKCTALNPIPGNLGAVVGVIGNDYLVAPENLIAKPRSEAEKDPNFKQIIAYVLFVKPKEDGSWTVLKYERTSKGGEERLHNKWSIGIGGHMNDEDPNKDIDETVMREIDEELLIESPLAPDETSMLPGIELDVEPVLCGFVNEEASEVGTVHLGAVYVVVLPPDATVKGREKDLANVEFLTMEQLQESAGRLETWSQLVFYSIPELLDIYNYFQNTVRYWYGDLRVSEIRFLRETRVSYGSLSFALEEAMILAKESDPEQEPTLDGSDDSVGVAWSSPKAHRRYETLE